ncbi:LysM peptidoglycan-binding domain-containing protein [Flavobacterium sp. XN-5]|uniref:glucosaminidase domain-containing protein n=1 Tax=Flavobacterium sp. XN-5 TaxID=2599390 RepID=UPI0011C9F44D|nr:glucosaminidase domain-containing protein [Flavobacterium sp. XN-5]NGY36073.1 LysM peptidoglycan-binding domain-containing protein [Flavobacterium sp. XN-5]
MYKKIIVILTVLTLISCNVTKSPIVTAKPASAKNSKAVVKKKNYTKTEKTTVINNRVKSQRTDENEVIESTSRTVVPTDVIGRYVYDYKDVAMNNMKVYGIPASIILAQGILESGAGRGDLASRSNNHFGIKCHTGWEGESVRHDDDAEQECFRKYNDPSESYKDHALFLTGRSRYSRLFNLPKDDYQAWAKGLRSAGYATDPKYPDKLISYIERYNLGQFDAQVLGTKYTPIENKSIRIASVNSTYNGPFYEVQKGDTLYSISKKYNVMIDDLKVKNNLSDNTISIGQRLIVN